MSKPTLFVSYSRKDEKYLEDFKVQTAGLRRNNQMELWTDQDITAGKVWEKTLKQQLESADIIVFLLSPDFIASDYIYDVEITKAIERHDNGEVIIVPVLIRPCDFDSTPLTKFQALPKNAKPIKKWEDTDEAWMDVVIGLKKTIASIPETIQQKDSDQTINSDSNTSINKKAIKGQIAEGKIENALKDLLAFTKAKDNDLHNSVIMQSSKYNRFKRDNLNGTLSSEDRRIALSKIENALLAIVDELGLS